MESTIRTAFKPDLSAIVKCHLEAFPGFFLSVMGPLFLRKYYGIYLDYDKGIVLVAEFEGQLLGFVAGFQDPASYYAKMRDNRLSLGLAALAALWRHPTAIRRALFNRRRIQSESSTNATTDEDARIGMLAVDPSAQGGGIGRKLVEEFIAVAKSRGVHRIDLTTDAVGNDSVNAFYQRIGFQIIDTFLSGPTRQMHRYEYIIETEESNP